MKYIVIYCKGARIGSFEFTTEDERFKLLSELHSNIVLVHIQTDVNGTEHYNAIGVKHAA